MIRSFFHQNFNLKENLHNKNTLLIIKKGLITQLAKIFKCLKRTSIRKRMTHKILLTKQSKSKERRKRLTSSKHIFLLDNENQDKEIRKIMANQLLTSTPEDSQVQALM